MLHGTFTSLPFAGYSAGRYSMHLAVLCLSVWSAAIFLELLLRRSRRKKLCRSAITNVDSRFYNAMINPYTVGPMALVGFTWYQGEANVDEVKGTFGASRYACTFPAMIKEWRRAFKNPEAFFGFVQLSTWCGNGELIAEMRTNGQMSALSLPNVGYATNADHGAGCNLHPSTKQYCAKRLPSALLHWCTSRRLCGSHLPSSPRLHRLRHHL